MRSVGRKAWGVGRGAWGRCRRPARWVRSLDKGGAVGVGGVVGSLARTWRRCVKRRGSSDRPAPRVRPAPDGHRPAPGERGGAGRPPPYPAAPAASAPTAAPTAVHTPFTPSFPSHRHPAPSGSAAPSARVRSVSVPSGAR